jgi:hypothetical protein
MTIGILVFIGVELSKNVFSKIKSKTNLLWKQLF